VRLGSCSSAVRRRKSWIGFIGKSSHNRVSGFPDDSWVAGLA
jgi:hypothetical protein